MKIETPFEFGVQYFAIVCYEHRHKTEFKKIRCHISALSSYITPKTKDIRFVLKDLDDTYTDEDTGKIEYETHYNIPEYRMFRSESDLDQCATDNNIPLTNKNISLCQSRNK